METLCWKHDRNIGHKRHPKYGLWLRGLPIQWKVLDSIYARVSVHKNKPRNTMEAVGNKYQACFTKSVMLYINTFPQQIFWWTTVWLKYVDRADAKHSNQNTTMLCYIWSHLLPKPGIAHFPFLRVPFSAPTECNHARKCFIKTTQSWN